MSIKKAYIIDIKVTEPYENLAFEEYILNHLGEETVVLLLWQNDNSVVIGQNQNPLVQCNMKIAERENVNIVRRLSGGGSVYHDLGNLNYSFLKLKTTLALGIETEIILNALSMYEISPEKKGRNDILLNGKKISGNAFYEKDGKECQHGTLLIDSNLEKMVNLLRVDEGKWREKGIASVRSRVENVKTVVPYITVEDVKEKIKSSFLEKFSQANILEVTDYRKFISNETREEFDSYVNRYHSKEWIFGRKIPMSYSTEKRFSWGYIAVCMELEGDLVKNIILNTDAMETEVFTYIKEKLCDTRLEMLRSGKTIIDTMEEDLYMVSGDYEQNKIIINDIYELLIQQF